MARRIVALGGLLRRALPAAAALSGGTVLHCTDDGPPRLDDHRALLKGGHDAAEAIDLDASEVQQQRPPQDLRKCDLTVDEERHTVGATSNVAAKHHNCCILGLGQLHE